MKSNRALDSITLFPAAVVADLWREQRSAGRDAKFIPVGENGRATAILVYAIERDGHAAAIGLCNDDEIIAVNGRYVVEQPKGIIEMLYREPLLVLNVRRAGARRMLYWKAAPQ